MAAKLTFDEVVKKLRQSPTNITCVEMKKMLEHLGFQVTKGTQGNHHRFKHAALSNFHGGKFDCGKKTTLKPCYPRDLLSILLEFEAELKPTKPENSDEI